MDAAPATLMYVSVLAVSRLPKPKSIGNSLLGGFNETTVHSIVRLVPKGTTGPVCGTCLPRVETKVETLG